MNSDNETSIAWILCVLWTVWRFKCTCINVESTLLRYRLWLIHSTKTKVNYLYAYKLSSEYFTSPGEIVHMWTDETLTVRQQYSKKSQPCSVMSHGIKTVSQLFPSVGLMSHVTNQAFRRNSKLNCCANIAIQSHVLYYTVHSERLPSKNAKLQLNLGSSPLSVYANLLLKTSCNIYNCGHQACTRK